MGKGQLFGLVQQEVDPGDTNPVVMPTEAATAPAPALFLPSPQWSQNPIYWGCPKIDEAYLIFWCDYKSE